jgi:hypothetical protein
VDIHVLVLRGWEILKLGAYDVSLFGGDVGKDVEEVGRGSDDGGWGARAIGIAVRGKTITSWAGVVLGIVGTIQVLLDDLVGGGDINLIGVVN